MQIITCLNTNIDHDYNLTMGAEVIILIGSIFLLMISIGMYVGVQYWRRKVVKEPHPASRPFMCDGAGTASTGESTPNTTASTNS